MNNLAKWYEAVEAFQVNILGNKAPREVQVLNELELEYTHKHLNEELHELGVAKNVYQQADALTDLIYVALGGLFKMGIAPGVLFQEVHDANMRKDPASTDRTKHDAVKSKNWIGPDLPMAIAKALAFQVEMPELFKRVQAKVAQRGESYNTSGTTNKIEVEDYFPFGHPSHAQMVHIKALRLIATVSRDMENPDLPDCAEHVVDLAAYLSFYFDFIMEQATQAGVPMLDEVEEKLAQ